MPRQMHKYHYLYKTTNLINNKFYVGMHSTDNLEDGYIGSGKMLWFSIRKYGKENFKREILEFFESRILLKEREKNYVNENFIKDPMCMNLMIGGGEGGFFDSNHMVKCSIAGHKAYAEKLKTDKEFFEKRSKISSKSLKRTHKAGKIKYNVFKGKTHSKASKEKMSEKAKERTKEKNSQFGTCWITHLELGNKKIKTKELKKYIKFGWSKGRKIK